MKKRFAFPVLLMALAGILIALMGCKGHGPRHGDPDKRAELIINKLKTELDLSADQVNLLKDIKQQIQEKIAANKTQREEHFAFAKEQIRKDELDIPQIEKYMDSQQDQHREMRDFILAQIKRFHDTLTQAQKQKLVSLLEEFKGAWYNHSGF